jgi:hypothetical protein
MKRILSVLLLITIISGCSARTDPQGSSAAAPNQPTLTITASPRQGFTPLRVTLRGQLTGVDANSQEYYCLQEIWDFGDGAKSSEKPNCDPYSTDSKVKKEFFIDHVYEKEGRYTVRFFLGEEDNETIRSRQVGVVVLERVTSNQWRINTEGDRDAPAATAR